MDIFLEQLVKHKKTTADYVKIVLLTIAAVVITVVGFIANLMFSKYLFGLGYLVIAGIWYGYYLLFQTFNIEYEYIMTNDEMDIDKVVAKRGRKSVITVNFREIEICARANDGEYKSMAENTDGLSKVIDATGERNADNVYFVDFHDDGGKCRVFFQPTEKMLDAAYKFNPRLIHK